jgi:hypothetical protein
MFGNLKKFEICLLEAFTSSDPKSAKKTDGLTVFFTLLGSASVKAVHKTLIKLSSEEFEILMKGKKHIWSKIFLFESLYSLIYYMLRNIASELIIRNVWLKDSLFLHRCLVPIIQFHVM